MSGDGAVQFVCLGKGRHQKRYPHVTFLASGMRFRCSACGRDLQLRADRFASVLADLRAAAFGEVDISILPY